MEKIIRYTVGTSKELGRGLKFASVVTDKDVWVYREGLKNLDDLIENIVSLSEDYQLLYFDKINCFLLYDKDASDLLEKFGVKNQNIPKRGKIHISMAQGAVYNMSADLQKEIATFFNEPVALYDKTNTIKSLMSHPKKNFYNYAKRNKL